MMSHLTIIFVIVVSTFNKKNDAERKKQKSDKGEVKDRIFARETRWLSR